MPVEGSKTEARGKKAHVHISNEIVELCEIIQTIGQQQADGTYAVRFHTLFEFYTRISNKVVGILKRAKKQGLVDFGPEMLFQRRDDHEIITLLKMPNPDELHVTSPWESLGQDRKTKPH